MTIRAGISIRSRLFCCLFLLNAIALGQGLNLVTLASSPNPANYGQAVTLTATVPAGATGKVTFYDGTSVLGVATVSGTQATLTTVMLASGNRSLRAYYGGEATHAASSSGLISQTVVAGASLGFRPAVNVSAGPAVGTPVSLATGDFNGDGKQDLAIADGNTVNVAIGNGDGTFQAAVSYNAGSNPHVVAEGDLNGDGKMDLIVGNLNGGGISVLLGNGDGTFQAALNNFVGSSPSSLAVGDFDGDGRLDVVFGDFNDIITVLLGNGAGGFRTFDEYVVPGSVLSIAVGDINGDGYADIVVSSSNGVSVLPGNGDGTFGARVDHTVVFSPFSITIADFNNDGKADLAVGSGAIDVFLGNGDGSFQAAANYAVGPPGPIAMAVGDFNGDGKPDLAFASNFSGAAGVLLGNGDGTFQSVTNYLAGPQLTTMAAGDFNGDGKVDLVLGAVGDKLSILLGGGAPDLAVAQTHDGGFTQGQQGASYTITVNNVGGVASSGAVGVVAMLGAPLTAVAIGGNGWTCTLATVTCVRSDSLAAGASYPAITIKLNVASNYTGNVTSSASVSGGGEQNTANNTASDTAFVRFATTTGLTASPNPAVLGHAVTITATVTPGATGKVTFYDSIAVLGVATLTGGQAVLTTSLLPSGSRSLRAEYIGDSTYGPSASSAVPQTITASVTNAVQLSTSYKAGTAPAAVAVADLNRDGKPDLITANSGDGTISVLLGNGDGTFRPALTQNAGTSAGTMVVGDFNGDGFADIAIAGFSGISILLGKGDGTFQAATVNGPNSYSSLASADLNADGKLDLVALNSGGGIVILLGNGDGTFQPPVVLNSNGTGFSFVAAADVNGDGKVDLVASNTGFANPASVFLGNGDGTFQLPLTSTVIDTYPMGFAVGDFNGDGKSDIAVTYWTGVALSLGKGDGTFSAPVKFPINFVPGYFATAGDFNGDGKLDIAAAGYFTNSLFIAFGNGDGTFSFGTQFPTDGYSVTAATGDFNGDGKPDFVTANSNSGTVNLFLGNQSSGLSIAATHKAKFTAGQTGAYQISVGNPAFAGPTGTVTVTDTLPAGLSATAISGSGWTCTLNTLTCTRSDALSAGATYPAITLTVSVSAGLSPSTINNQASVSNAGIVNPATDPTIIVLPTTTALAASPNPAGLGQTVLMTATVSAGTTGSVSFFDGGTPLGAAALTGGAASLSTSLLTSGIRLLRATYAGDATHAPSTSAAKSQTVTAGAASGLGTPASYATGVGPSAVVVGDFNRDGLPDLVTANSGGNTVSVLLGASGGTFGAKVDYAAGTQPVAIVTADFNNDGKADLAVANQMSNNVSILLGNGDGTFQAATNYPAGSEPISLAVGDFNGDGTADLVISPQGFGPLTLLLGNGDGSFNSGTMSTTGAISAVAVGDFNGDGKLDIAYSDNGQYVLLGNGDGTFQPPVFSSNIFSGSDTFAVGDLNGDGKSDIVAVDPTNGVNVLVGKGDGTFQFPQHYSVGSTPLSIVIADVNGDGKLDVAVANSGSNTISILLGNGDGTLQPAISYNTGSQPRGLAVGDFNGDGRTDLAVANSQSNNVSVFLGVLTPVLGAAISHTGSFGPGQTGGIYSITVNNQGPGVTSGAVTVTDSLPSGLTATAIAGNGWSCNLQTLTCTRSDSLSAGGSYPAISVTVNVASNAPPQVINQVTVSGSGSPTANASDVTTIIPLTPTAHIDAPSPGSTVSGVITVAGWALDNALSVGTAVGGVQVLVDGAPVGAATYGASRPDVCAAYPGRPGCPNVGFTYQLNITALGPGQHTITVSATDTDATPDSGTTSVTVTVTAVPPTVHIDAPLAGSVLAGTAVISGWAVDNSSVSGTAIGSLQVKVDGVTVGTATYGASRPDVCSAYPGRPGCPNVGFTYPLNLATLSPGPHTVTVSATDTDATPDLGTASVTITVASGPPSVYIDSPSPGAVVNGTVTVSGWALDNISATGTAIGNVQVKVDGAPVGTATYGTSRPDVCSAYPGRPGCPNVGFTYQWNTAALSPGLHTLTAAASDSDVNPDVGNWTITIRVAAPPSVTIDLPAPNSTLVGNVTVAGWAIDNISSVGTAIGSVKVLVDGVVVGTAVYGGNRPDVCAAYAGRPGCPNVGFSYTFNAFSLTPGPHTLAVTATDTDGNPDVGSASIPVTVAAVPPSVHIDSPAPGSTVAGVVTVAGWAIDNTAAAGTAIGSVQVKVDGVLVGTATYGVNRPDVCAAYAGRPGCPSVGFNYAWNTTALALGTHTITVTATDTDGTPDVGSQTITVTVSGAPPSVHIDSPAPGSAVSGTVTVAGWAIDSIASVGTAIAAVQVLVDGVQVGTATYGVNRLDVCAAFPGRPGCPNVGFAYQLNAAALSAGSHTLTVTATDTDGNPDAGSASITIVR